MENIVPILIFIIVMLFSLLRAVRDAQRTREQQERQFPGREEKFPESRKDVLPRRMIPGEEARPPEIPETLTEARYILRKALHPEKATVPEAPKTIPLREEPLREEFPTSEADKVFEEAVAVSISKKLTKEGEPPHRPKLPVFMEPVPAVPLRGELRLKVKLPFRGPDVVKGIIYHEILGPPLGLKNVPGNREM